MNHMIMIQVLKTDKPTLSFPWDGRGMYRFYILYRADGFVCFEKKRAWTLGEPPVPYRKTQPRQRSKQYIDIRVDDTFM
jgi:hypothetical protein